MWWFILENGQPQNAMTPTEFMHAVQSGRVTADTLLATDTDPNWKAAEEWPELTLHFRNDSAASTRTRTVRSLAEAPQPQLAATKRHYRVEPPEETPVVSEPPPEPEIAPEQEAANPLIESERKICPHCWHRFPVSQALYIAQHPSLFGDDVVRESQKRFRPKRFDAAGNAVDAGGMSCPDMACPRCHLRIPPTAIDLETHFFSIIGAPASGKTYFLTSMLHQLKQHLSEDFDLSFSDADPMSNAVLTDHENLLFLAADPEQPVALEKTQMTGDLYDSVLLNGREINLPKPFIYKLHAQWTRPDGQRDWNIVLYDNAGEHFQPGNDDFNNPGTQHLAHSDGVIFLFDPTADPRFRRVMSPETFADGRVRVQNQVTLLAETLARLRRYRALGASEKYRRPFIVAVSKFDEWSGLCPLALRDMQPYFRDRESRQGGCNGYLLDNVSFYTRAMLLKFVPEFVQVVEDNCSDVVYLPNSALGGRASRDPATGLWGIRPAAIVPIWAEVPLLVLLMRKGLIPEFTREPDERYRKIDDFSLNEDYILFDEPESGRTLRLPRSFAGKLLSNPETGCHFIVPGTAETAETGNGDEFWEHL